MKLGLVLQRLGLAIVFLLFSILPVFFLPFTTDYFDLSKNLLLFVGVSLASLFWAGSMIATKQVRFTLSPLNLPIIGILVTWIVSSIVRSPNQIEAFLTPGQTGTIVLLCLLYFVITNLINNKREFSLAMGAFFLGLGLMGVVNIIWASGLKIPVFSSPLWNPLGSPLATIVVDLLTAIMAIVLIFKSSRMEASTYLVSLVLLTSLVAASLFSYRLFIASKNNILLMSQSSAWSVALDVLKIPTSALLGTGPGSYATSAVRFRPISDNMNKNWNIRFGSSSNYYLEIITLLGGVGLLVYLNFIYRVISLGVKSIKENISADSVALSVGLIVLFVVHFFLPATFVSISLVFILSALLVSSIKICSSHAHLVSETNIDVITASNSVKTPVLPWIIITLMLVAIIPSAIIWSQAYAADIFYKQALVSAANNDGRATYTKLVSAINLNPYKDTYRSAYSQTNFLLASSLSNKKDISEQDQKNISDLVQAAISEGKQAMNLGPTRASNAESLASLYSNLINIAKNAENWSLDAYRIAISLDPTNPNLRIALGGVLYKIEDYEGASRAFVDAINLKPDFPNAYYNLASVYKQTKAYDKAVSAMREVVRLLDSASTDYTKANQELEELRKLAGDQIKPEPTQTTASQLTKPGENTAPKVNTPVNLDQSSTSSAKPATIN